MAKDNVRSWDATAGNNIDMGGIPLAENVMAPPAVNDAFRESMSQIAEMLDEMGYPTAGGTANALTLTPATAVTAYASGDVWTLKAASSNTGAATLNISGVGAKAIRKIVSGTDVALAANDIQAGVRYGLVYDSAANSAAGAFIIVSGASFDAAYPAGHLYGLTLSNNVSDATNDIDIAAGSARDETNTVNMVLASALTKRLDAAWAVGTNQGGLDTGAIANTTYHIWLIKRSDTGVVDAVFSASASAPTMPANYDYKRRIGSIVRTSGAIRAFDHFGDVFTWDSPPALDEDAVDPGTAAVTVTISVPTGVVVEAFGAVYIGGQTGTSNSVRISALASSDVAPSRSVTPLADVSFSQGAGGTGGGRWNAFTNTSAQVRRRVETTSAGTVCRIATYGWIDRRGRLG